MDGRGIIIGAVSLVVAVMIMSTVTWDVQEVETHFSSKPYTYETSFVRAHQVRNFPWIFEVTQAQYIVKNTDVQDGTFGLNFIFDNGADTGTRTEEVAVRAGEEKTVTEISPLNPDFPYKSNKSASQAGFTW